MSATSATPTYISVLKKYNGCSPAVRGYFDQLPLLINGKFPYEVCLAYLFIRLERAHNDALYCGVVKIHKASATMSTKAIESQHLTRDGFLGFYKTVFGKPIAPTTLKFAEDAEKVRDKVIHGKPVKADAMREALVDVLAYAEALNAELNTIAGIEPFGKLSGFKGAAKSLENSTSRWLLKGMGFALS